MNYLLSCDRCKNDFDEDERMPLILSEWGHTFWAVCLREILHEEEEKICPECTSPFRENDESQFRQNIKILKFMRERGDREIGFDEHEDTIECSKHLRKPVEYFCKSWSTSVCVKCIYDDHNGHHLMQIEEMSGSLLQNINDLE